METNQSDFKLDSLSTFSLDSLRELLMRITRLATASDMHHSAPIRWVVGVIGAEANRRLAVYDGELLEQEMVIYPMNFDWPVRELRNFISILTTLSYSQLDKQQAKFVDETLWFAIAEVCARCEAFESIKGSRNVA
jgi:hypothetical protein